MLSLIVTILFALAIAYFAIQNTIGVPLVIANNVFTSVPLFFIVIGSVLLGVLMSSVISGLNSLTAYLAIRGKDHVIHEDARAIHSLQNKIQELESENARLRTEEKTLAERNVVLNDNSQQTVEEEKISMNQPVHRPSFFYNLFHPRV